MLNSLTATVDPVLAVPNAATAAWSVVERDEFGPLTGPAGLFTAGAVPLALIERDELGRRLTTFTPDGDLV